MSKYRVFYQTRDTINKVGFQDISVITKDTILQTHIYIKDVEANNVDDVYTMMQGEMWSPNGEARKLIQSKGLLHTSMSVGDVTYDCKDGKFYVVDFVGFKKL